MQIRTLPINRINPAPYNPRLDLKPGDADYDKLKRSIDEFGCVEPLVWNKRTGHLVGGHQRFKILRDQGLEKIQVSVVDLSLEQEKTLNIALNKISGDWDNHKLALLLDELTQVPDMDVALTGFDLPDIRDIVGSLSDEDAEDNEQDLEPDLTVPAITQPGELFELGDHRLLCGDSTDPEHVRRLMDGQRARLFATDPPYLVDYDGTNHPGAKGRNRPTRNKHWGETYGKTWDDADSNPQLYELFIKAAVAEAITQDAAWYCWHRPPGYELPHVSARKPATQL